ncbi:MAG: hypothetical protein Q8P67_02685 [archaeon]|nr:hypothetical protein [archaeon]
MVRLFNLGKAGEDASDAASYLETVFAALSSSGHSFISAFKCRLAEQSPSWSTLRPPLHPLSPDQASTFNTQLPRDI